MSSESTISTSVAVGITLGNGVDVSPFTVTSTGIINGPSYTGITDATDATSPTVYNDGSIHAEYGIAFQNVGTVVNSGDITGTVGVYLLNGGMVSNDGSIDGTAVGLFLGAYETAGNGGGWNQVTSTSGGGGTSSSTYYTLSGSWNRVHNNNPGGGYGIDGDLARFSVETPSVSVSNAVGGTIIGGAIGIYATTLVPNITNAGHIEGNLAGIYLDSGGDITNAAKGIIASDASPQGSGKVGDGIHVKGGVASIYNAGSILSGTRDGIYLGSGGDITNAVGGIISNTDSPMFSTGAGDGIDVKEGIASIYNAGFIGTQTKDGIYLGSGGSITNASTGHIFGTSGIVAEASTTIVTAGIIGGSAYAVQFGTDATASVLSIDPGAAFIYVQNSPTISIGYVPSVGAVADEAGDGTLDLAAGTAGMAGTLSGLGTDFTGFSNVTVDVDAGWTLNGANTLSTGATLVADGTLSLGGNFVNDGGVTADLSMITLYGGLTGTGIVNVGTDSAILITGSVASGETFDLDGGGIVLEAPTAVLGGTVAFMGAGEIQLGAAASAGYGALAVINGFGSGDTIDVTSAVLDGNATLSGSVLGGDTIETITSGNLSESFTFSGSYASDFFNLVADGNGGEEIVANAPCYCLGTHIRTVMGEIPVEQLKIGDKVLTESGMVRPIKWIGTRSYDGKFIAGQHLMLPVCIKANAMEDGVPARDLYVSPGHAIFCSGMLIPAWRLINGVSITQAEQVERVTYFHVELESHDVILAENCPAESFLDDGCRGQFHNAATFAELYNEDASAPGIARVESGVLLAAVQYHLAARAGARLPHAQDGTLIGYVDQAGDGLVSGWAQNKDAPEAPVFLEIYSDGKRVADVLANAYRADLRAAGIGSGCHAFEVRLAVECTGRIEVRRKTDQAVLALTEAASARAA